MGLCAIASIRSLTDAELLLWRQSILSRNRWLVSSVRILLLMPRELKRAVRSVTGCRMIGNSLSGGADVTIDAVGSAGSITTSLETTRPRGRIVMMGIPGTMSIDLTSLWHREIEIVGSYTYGTEILGDGSTSTSYDLAFTLVRENKLERL